MEKYSFLIKDSASFKALNKERQSYLFSSKDIFALQLAVDLLIENQTQASRLSSPDIVHFREKISVDDIDFINKNALIAPLELKYKYFIIEKGGFMNESASNKLLKILEEPYEKVKIIIFSPDESSVLATIRSRCILFRLNEFDINQINSVLDIHYGDSQNLSLAKEINLGSILRAERAISGFYNNLLDLALNILLFLNNEGSVLIFAQKLIEKKDDIYEIVELIELILHDCILNSLQQRINLLSRRADIIKISAFYDMDSILNLKEQIIKTKIRINGFGNINSIVDEFLFNLLNARRKNND